MEILGSILFCIGVYFFFNWREPSRIAWKTAEDHFAEIEDNSNKHAQEMEDKRYYMYYEINRRNRIRETISDESLRTQKAIRDIPNLKECISEEALEEITGEYEKYLQLCEAVDWIGPLSKQEFLIKKKNPLWCASISFKPTPLELYTIYHLPSAKYAGENSRQLLAKEFDEKWGLV